MENEKFAICNLIFKIYNETLSGLGVYLQEVI